MRVRAVTDCPAWWGSSSTAVTVSVRSFFYCILKRWIHIHVYVLVGGGFIAHFSPFNRTPFFIPSTSPLAAEGKALPPLIFLTLRAQQESKKVPKMIVHPAAYIVFLCLQLQTSNGELSSAPNSSPSILRKGQLSRNAERKSRPKRQLKKDKSKEAIDVEDGIIDTLEEYSFIQTDETPLPTDQPGDSPATEWPTYHPTPPSPFIEVDSPVVVSPSIEVHSGCDPIGSRSMPVPRPKRNIVTKVPSKSPVPESRRPDTYEPTASEVTFRRGDMLKDIARLGIRGEVFCVSAHNICSLTNSHHALLFSFTTY